MLPPTRPSTPPRIPVVVVLDSLRATVQIAIEALHVPAPQRSTA